MQRWHHTVQWIALLGIWSLSVMGLSALNPDSVPTLNQKADGYRGIWYYNQKSNDKYVYKYSGGLGTYCAKHRPFAIYSKDSNKTFFCYGGAAKGNNRRLLHMVSYYDHATGKVPRPTILLDKATEDAHDNPIISLDKAGFIWIFSTSHGTSRPSLIHRSKKPFDINEFERVPATHQTANGPAIIDNFSYMQVWNLQDKGFAAFFTRYHWPADRTLCFITSEDGVEWSERKRLAAMEKGHYQITAATDGRMGSAFNYHPSPKGLNWRTNLYYIETQDLGETWCTAGGTPIELPLTDPKSPALIGDYESQGRNVYLKDIQYDNDKPVILFIASGGYESGPKNDPREWTLARWTGERWDITPTGIVSDNNYDMGSMFLEPDGTWRLIAPTETGPQPYNPGGEIAMWISTDHGKRWTLQKRLTQNSERNHTYARRVLNAHPDFYALWADGHGRQPSHSRLYMSDKSGNVRELPWDMDSQFAEPKITENKETLSSAKNSLVASTPPMGWNSWNAFDKNINENMIKEMAEAIVDSGLAEAGYKYINIDGGWCGSDANQAKSEKFPSGIKHLADYMHEHSLKLGLYTHWRSNGKEKRDAQQWSDWGIDFIKNDAYKTKSDDPYWARMHEAIQATGRPMVHSIHFSDEETAPENIPDICNMWRITNDIQDYYNREHIPENMKWAWDTLSIIDRMAEVVDKSRPGCWLDPDMMEIGNGNQTLDEYRTQFSMWCLLPAPLIMGHDVRTMTTETLSILGNREAIAVNQDISHLPTRKVRDDGPYEVWARKLQDNSIAVVLLNRSDLPKEIRFTWREIGLDTSSKAMVRDLWKHENLGESEGHSTLSVPRHGCAFLRITP